MGEQTNQQLVEYIRQSRSTGVADDEIRRALLSSGWSEGDIDAAFAEMGNGTEQPNLPTANQQATSQPGSSSVGLPSATELLKTSFRVLKRRYFDALKLFIIPIAIFLVIFLILALAGFMAGSNPVGWGLSHLTAQISQNAPTDSGSYPYSFDKPSFSPILFVFIIILLSTGLIFYTITTIALIRLFGKDEPLKFSEYLKFGVANFWSYVWVIMLTSLIVVGGMILLIVPGVIFSVWFGLGIYALILEGHRGRAALLRSKQLVSGKWGSVFWRFLFFSIISQLILLPFYILSIFSKSTGSFLTYAVNILLVLPLSLAYGASLFCNLSQVKTEPFVEDKKAANKFIVVGILGLVTLFVLVGFLFLKIFKDVSIISTKRDRVSDEVQQERYRAEDERKIADTTMIHLALQLYFDDNHIYPTQDQLEKLLVPKYILQMPFNWFYQNINYAHDSIVNPKRYHMWTNLHNSNHALQTDSDFDSQAVGWFGSIGDGGKEECRLAKDCIFDLVNQP